MNEGQRRYAMEQYNLALVRRGLPIDHPIPSAEADSEYETADEGDLPGVDDSDVDGYQTAEEELHSLGRNSQSKSKIRGTLSDIIESDENDNNRETTMPNAGRATAAGRGGAGPSGTGTGGPVAGPSGTGMGGKALKRHPTGDSGIGEGRFGLTGTARDQGGDDSQLPSGEGELLPLPRPTLSVHSYIRHYRKVHRFFTYGISYQIIELASGGTPNIIHHICTTPLANVPWTKPYLYLNPSEYAVLPDSSHVEHVSCQIRIRNARIAFDTNSTATQTATLNQQRDICYAVGLNKSLNTINVHYTSFEDNENMIPSECYLEGDNQHQNMRDDMYGKAWTDAVGNSSTPRHQMGIPMPLLHYCAIPYAKQTPEPGYPCLQSHVNYFDYDNAMGMNLKTVSYKPRNGLLKKSLKPVVQLFPGYTTADKQVMSIPRGGMKMGMQQSDITVALNTNEPTAYKDTDVTMKENPGQNITFRDVDDIEKCQWIRHGYDGSYSVDTQPSLHIAVQPVPAISTPSLAGVSNSHFTDVQGYWEVVCEMQVNTQYPTPFPLYGTTHTTSENNTWFGTMPQEYISLYNGLKRIN